MDPKFRTLGKRFLSKLLPDSTNLRYLANLPKLETFLKSHTEQYPFFHNREKVYDFINKEIILNGQIQYLEFGVFKGESIKYWADINTDSRSKFYGFDTFTGLPEKWSNFTGSLNANFFDTGGRCPNVDDTRVSFIKGLFQDTLPTFLNENEIDSQLVIHNDSDLYSANLYVLSYANDIIVPGTIIIFDEFSSMLHEFRALEDYCSSYMRDYEIVGVVKSPIEFYSGVAIIMK